ncbi:polysaccharide deacetylase family protein [Leptotrichia buccalis]|uniref:Polysaccharide deacetylase n=1 Tax=Leptotrichia buccalis (strain ATCC 14201 / DSM 1135 / JCM 12969 / NCTC 10249 / C-1013-b) TaxID=523794 RepID=C7NE04_LEPBD|nr:polysaccharide deacetylase family protein [Leptotrichia buccalis]ACV40118.1 polysaccharide deacetylase [Leptotrichia buccalis C-1013-b]
MIYTYLFLTVVLIFLIFIIYNKTRKSFVLCLMYHSVDNEKGKGGIFVNEFEEHIKWIKDKKTFKMEELKNLNYTLPKNSILITFDDGYKNNYTLAFPILKKYNMKATIFLNTKFIGKDEFYLNWDEIKEMYESGLVDFQLHTHSHQLTIKDISVLDFYDEESSPYFKRESYNLFFEGNYDEKKDKEKLYGLPVFKLRSKISIAGYKPKKDFLKKYQNIKQLQKFNKNEKKDFLNKLFKEKQNEFFDKISEEQFRKTVEFEILENKKIIKKNLGKTPDCLAYPWGHRYNGNREDIRKLGVDVFITTRKGVNSLKLNKNWIYRVSGDDFENFDEFKQELTDGSGPYYRKLRKIFTKK